MTTHPLIDAELAALADELPEPFVAELADGYAETYAAQRRSLDPDQAATATVAEFGDAATICAAFAARAPGRRFARALVITGPAFGASWAAALLTQPSLRSALGTPVRVLGAAVLLAVVVTLLVTSTGRLRYRATRTASVSAAYALVPFDVSAVATVIALGAPAPATVVAVALSLSRITYTLTALRTV
ncbi:hypothetical protein ACWEOW_18570 [Monashia sp. NPDC004114]